MIIIRAKKLILTAVLVGSTVLAGCASTSKQESTGQYVDSSTITAKVKTNLISDPDIKSLPISVKTYKGTVQLSGFVDNYEQKQRAIAAARSVPGVTAVTDSLVVK